MKKIIALSITALAASYVCAAETYNIEAGGQYQKSSVDDKTDTTATILAGTYYLKDIVIDHSQPFAELDVLQKASGVTVRYGNVSLETAALSKTTLNPVELGGTFYVDNFVFGLNNQTWDKNFNLKSNSAQYYGIKSTSTGFNVGYWVLPTTVVSFNNESHKATYTRSTNSLTAINDLKVNSNGVSSHTVTSLGGTQSLVVDLSYSQIKTEQDASNNNKEYAGKVRYYPEAKYYVEGGYIVNTGDYASDKGKTTLIGAGFEVTPRFGVLLTTAKFNGDVASEKSSSTTTTVTAGYRF
jgi:hypothetical protein